MMKAPRINVPLTIHRTDASTQTASTPPSDRLDPKAKKDGIVDYFRALPAGHEKELLWRWKLATQFIEILEPSRLKVKEPKDYMFTSLPEHYRLYEHIRKEKPEKKGAASKPKVEVYLFGYPAPNKCFRSPAEFAPHMLWLGMNGGVDRSKCECAVCKGTELPLPFNDIVKIETIPPPRTRSTTSTKTSPPQNQPNQLDLHLNQIVRTDSSPGYPLFRPLELVWAMPEGPYPRISIILSRIYSSNANGQHSYIVYPLNSPRLPDRSTIMVDEDRVRPWLSWTAPPPEHPEMLGSKGEVAWKYVDWSKYPQSATEISDASVLAGREISRSVSFIQDSTGRLAGIWLGAEKVWRGGEVRVATDPKITTDVMVIRDIVVNFKPGASGEISFIGNIYFRSKNAFNEAYPTPPPTERMLNDAASLESSWMPRLVNARLSLTDVRGRWYPTSLLRPILVPGVTSGPGYEDVSTLLNTANDGPRGLGGWKIEPQRLDAVSGKGEQFNGTGGDAGWLPKHWKEGVNEELPPPAMFTSVQPPPQAVSKPPPKEAPNTRTKKAAAKAQQPQQPLQMQQQQPPVQSLPQQQVQQPAETNVILPQQQQIQLHQQQQLLQHQQQLLQQQQMLSQQRQLQAQQQPNLNHISEQPEVQEQQPLSNPSTVGPANNIIVIDDNDDDAFFNRMMAETDSIVNLDSENWWET